MSKIKLNPLVDLGLQNEPNSSEFQNQAIEVDIRTDDLPFQQNSLDFNAHNNQSPLQNNNHQFANNVPQNQNSPYVQPAVVISEDNDKTSNFLFIASITFFVISLFALIYFLLIYFNVL